MAVWAPQARRLTHPSMPAACSRSINYAGVGGLMWAHGNAAGAAQRSPWVWIENAKRYMYTKNAQRRHNCVGARGPARAPVNLAASQRSLFESWSGESSPYLHHSSQSRSTRAAKPAKQVRPHQRRRPPLPQYLSGKAGLKSNLSLFYSVKWLIDEMGAAGAMPGRGITQQNAVQGIARGQAVGGRRGGSGRETARPTGDPGTTHGGCCLICSPCPSPAAATR